MNQILTDESNKPVATDVTLRKPYEPMPGEKAAMDLFHRRKNKTPRLKAVQREAGIELSLKHPEPVYGQMLLMKALATNELDFFGEIMAQLGKASVEHEMVNERRV